MPRAAELWFSLSGFVAATRDFIDAWSERMAALADSLSGLRPRSFLRDADRYFSKFDLRRNGYGAIRGAADSQAYRELLLLVNDIDSKVAELGALVCRTVRLNLLHRV